jgi:hypothetical protein
MVFIEIFLILLAAYLLVVWVLPWIWFPHLRTYRGSISLPADLKSAVDKFNKEIAGDLEFLRALLDLIKKRYEFGRFYMYFFPARWYETNLEKIWQDTRPQMCSVTNYLLEAMLFYSQRFRESQIRRGTTFTNFALHQYVEVTLKDGQKVVLDPWAYGMGAPFNKKVFGFV